MKQIISVLKLVFSLFIFTMFFTVQSQTKNKKPNILLILIDDCSADEIGSYGNTKHQTPVMDQLAKKGARFETCWSAPICSPSRALIMTGRYGFRTGWYHNKREFKRKIPLPKENIIFAQPLKKAGYRTAVAGKWQLPGKPPEYGFDEYSLWAYKKMLPKGVTHEGYDSMDPDAYNYKYMARYWYPSIIQNGSYLPTTNQDYGPDMHSKYLIEFMNKKADKPFFVYYPMILTHDPFYPTPQNVEGDEGKLGPSNKKKNFKFYVEYVDKIIGDIITNLKISGQFDNTAIIVTADNGTAGRGKGKSKEIGVREPLIVYWPGVVENQGVKRELVDFSDVFPTLMDIAGIDVPKGYEHDGRSFLPLLLGKEYKEREFVFSYLGRDRLVRDKRWLLEGDGRFFDCGENRNPWGYKEYTEVTDSQEAEVLEAKKRFTEFLKDKPAPK